MRTFIAIELTDEIKKQLIHAQEWLKGVGDIKWVKSEGLHLTLKFLGNIPISKIPHITMSMAEGIKRYSPFEISLISLGVFPHIHRTPRIIWAGIKEGEQTLRNLAEDIEISMISLGFPEEKRTFSPHITMGRIKGNNINMERLREIIIKHNNTQFGMMYVKGVHLIESKLISTDVIYRPLEEIKL